MSSDHPEPAPPLDQEDLSLESSLSTVRPRPATPEFVERLLHYLELTSSDELAVLSPNQPPMPLDASLLAFEHELRSLRPLDMDFPTGQRVLKALEGEMSPAPAPFSVVRGSSHSAPARRSWTAALPWAAAAGLVAVSWMALPHVRTGGEIARATDAGLIPFASRAGEKASIALVFPTDPRPDAFHLPLGPSLGNSLEANKTYENRFGNPPSVGPRPFVIPEATSPYGHLGVTTFDLPADYLGRLGLSSGITISNMGYGSPAHLQGLEVGDIIVRINGAPVSTTDDFSVMIKNSAPGSTVSLQIMRGRVLGKIEIRLGSAPSA